MFLGHTYYLHGPYAYYINNKIMRQSYIICIQPVQRYVLPKYVWCHIHCYFLLILCNVTSSSAGGPDQHIKLHCKEKEK